MKIKATFLFILLSILLISKVDKRGFYFHTYPTSGKAATIQHTTSGNVKQWTSSASTHITASEIAQDDFSVEENDDDSVDITISHVLCSVLSLINTSFLSHDFAHRTNSDISTYSSKIYLLLGVFRI